MLTDAMLGAARESQPALLKVHHLMIRVPDLDEAIHYYREMLGFAVTYREPHAACVVGGGLRLCLTSDEAAASRSGALDLVVEVTDVWAFYRHLRNRNVKASEPRVEEQCRPLLATSFVDPHGVRWSLVQSYP
jgi:catechol 2,3-dioxygenase-like lactoylglutathione lyase family enzyme